MVFFNYSTMQMAAKVVYYDTGLCGKTTNLQFIYGHTSQDSRGEMVSLETETDRTLFFDLLPIDVGSIAGFNTRIQLYTVPGQVFYNTTRKLVLKGVDGVVFVADSQRPMLQANLESLKNLQINLEEMNLTVDSMPIVLQYNKRDLPDILSEAELDQQFRFRPDIAAFPSVATEGHGVFETFVHAAAMLVESKITQYGLSRGKDEPREVADGVRRKLSELCDEARRSHAVVPIANLPQARVAVAESIPAPTVTPPTELVAEPSQDEPPAEYELSEAAPPTGPASAPSTAPTEEEFDLAYELRDTAGTPRFPVPGEVLTDADLDLELGYGQVDFHAPAPAEADDSLLDKTVQSNLELAKRFGELDEQRLLLDRKVQELVDVAQQTVHDLNRPLSAVRLMLATLDKGYLGPLTEPVQKAVQNGLQAVHQMDRLVRDLLDSSRLDHDGIQLEFLDCDLTLLLADVVRTLRYEIEDRDVNVCIEPLPHLRADSWALTKVFMNLLGNAITYAPTGARPQIRVWAEDAGSEWLLHVRDNGIGIPEQDRPRLFRRFERGSNTGGISGTGLGLHIVKEIVQGHGGWVSFQSEVGVGTTFVLHLPKEPVQPAHSPVSEQASLADL